MSEQFEKVLDAPNFINDYNSKINSNNKRDNQKTSCDKDEISKTDYTSQKNILVIYIKNDNNNKENGKIKKNIKKDIKKDMEVLNNKNFNKCINNDFNIESNKINIIKENNNTSGSPITLLGKKVKNNSEEIGNKAIQNDKNNKYDNGLLHLKSGIFQLNKNKNNNIIKANINNDINICDKIMENKNKNYSCIRNYNKDKCYNIDEIQLLEKTEEYKSTKYFDYNEESRKMENKLNKNFYYKFW